MVRDFKRKVENRTVCENLVYDVARMAVSHFATAFFVIDFDQVIHGLVLIFDSPLNGLLFQEFPKIAFRRVAHVDFVGNSSQKRLVDQFLRLEISGKHNQLIHRKLESAAVVELENIVAFLQGYNPAVENIGGCYSLPPKVVDDQCAAVAFQLDGRFADAGRGVRVNLEVVEREFAARNDCWALNSDLTFVDTAPGRHFILAQRPWNVVMGVV